jgi:putative addiction module component (TIGR02574 family)
MAVSFSREDIQRLSMAERLELIGDLWDSMAASESEPPLTDAQREELARRLDAYRADPEAGKSWDDVKKSLH